VESVLKDCYPALYAANLTKPASVTTVIAVGHVAVYVGPPEVSAAVDSPLTPGRIRLTVNQDLTGLAQVQIWKADSPGMSLLGTWDFVWINSTHIDLVGSVFAGTFNSCSLSAIIVTVV